MIEIIPSILTNDTNELRELIEKCEGVALPAGRQVDRVHIDIIDGKFANNRTIDPSALAEIDTNLKIDFHLMVNEPVNWVERCIRGMADRIIAQVEMMGSQFEYLGKVQEVGAKIGLGIDLDTPVSKLDPVILTNLDVVLVMSVAAGFGGQEFDQKAIAKIKELDEVRSRDESPYRICDDGGITFEKIHSLHYTGADEAAIGRRLFTGDLEQNLQKYRKLAYKSIHVEK